MAKPTRRIDHYWHKRGLCGVISRAALRTLQFVFAVTVAGLYGVDLAQATKTKTHAYPEWIYAEFVAALSVLTCIFHCFFTVTKVAWSAWDGVLLVLWLAQVGVFGSVYISGNKAEYEDATLSVPRMRAAVWIDLVNMVLWLATTVLGIAWCIRTRKVTRRTDVDVPKELIKPDTGNSNEEKALPSEKDIIKEISDEPIDMCPPKYTKFPSAPPASVSNVNFEQDEKTTLEV
ncbi:uncharacterized protein N7511_003617 [Penicillium nucicola]|uniref:uncharacterized protein n=1 Tax=Penicillium nucicola TaxID=1850975 RepID=UPI0025453EB4|nr:uncharacterized protein N7511_003617 [Penicillium nucicola]KAJ5766001.1 hypothetical protein N7511_003617 [Penicillium nucicola]